MFPLKTSLKIGRVFNLRVSYNRLKWHVLLNGSRIYELSTRKNQRRNGLGQMKLLVWDMREGTKQECENPHSRYLVFQ
jgi:hypothetical protein